MHQIDIVNTFQWWTNFIYILWHNFESYYDVRSLLSFWPNASFKHIKLFYIKLSHLVYFINFWYIQFGSNIWIFCVRLSFGWCVHNTSTKFSPMKKKLTILQITKNDADLSFFSVTWLKGTLGILSLTAAIIMFCFFFLH